MKKRAIYSNISNLLRGFFCIYIWFGILVVAAMADENVSQLDAGGNRGWLSATNRTSVQASSTNTFSRDILAQRLGGHPRDILLTNNFVEKDGGLFSRTEMSLGDVRRFLHFNSQEMRLIPSCPPDRQSYWVDLGDARCIIDIHRNIKETKNIHDDNIIVDIVINTNAPPAGHELSPRKTPANK
jgi:hypothetical protein